MLQKILSSSSYRMYNIHLARATSIHSSILLSYIFSLMEHHDSMEVFNSSVNIQKYTGLTKREVENAVNLLVKNRLIKKTVKGSPPITFFMFDDECHHSLNYVLLEQSSKDKDKDADNQKDKVSVSEFLKSQVVENEQFHPDGQLISPRWTIEFTQVDNKEYINKNIDNNKESKYHSPQSSDEDIQGDKPDLKIKEKAVRNPFNLTDEQMRLLKSYHKGFIEEIDKVAKVDYDKKITHLYRTFKLLKYDTQLLKDIYVYFRTFRDHGGTYTNEIRSLKALSEKIGKILPEMTRETKRKIQETGSIILHKDPEKKIIVYYHAEKIKQIDKTRLETAKAENYHMFDLSKQVGFLNLPEIGYVIQNTFG